MSVRDRLRGISIKWREQVVPADWAPVWKSDDGRWVIIVNVRAHRKDGDFRLFDTQGWLEVPDWIQVGDFLTFRHAQAEAERLASQETLRSNLEQLRLGYPKEYFRRRKEHPPRQIRPFRMPDMSIEDRYFVWYGPGGQEGDFAVDVEVELGMFSMSEYNDIGRRGFEKRTVQFDRDELRKAYGRPLPTSTVGKARLAARYGTDLFDRREPDVVETVMELP